MRISILLLLLVSFTTLHGELKTIYEYSFTTLKKSDAPLSLKVIRQNPDKKTLQSGILFTYKNRNAKKVHISGDFSKWKVVPMTRNKNGVWFFFLPEYSLDSSVRYKFLVDGIWIADPQNQERADDGNGSFVSITYPLVTPESKDVTYRFIRKNRVDFVEFRLFNTDATYIAVAGDFNNWNPENDRLIRGDDNIWRVQISIPDGIYKYKFIIDGRWTLDLYNSNTASDNMGGVTSLLEVSPQKKREIKELKTN